MNLWGLIALVGFYYAGYFRGVEHERRREERAMKKAEEKVIYLKDRR